MNNPLTFAAGAVHQFQTQVTYAGAGIDDKQIVAGLNLDAGGVAACRFACQWRLPIQVSLYRPALPVLFSLTRISVCITRLGGQRRERDKQRLSLLLVQSCYI